MAQQQNPSWLFFDENKQISLPHQIQVQVISPIRLYISPIGEAAWLARAGFDAF
ncbi:MAG: hypothetical protein Q8N96_02560 [Methylovulum sp.]|nr:hypothetical protein [Methylovulum sp.]